MERETAELQKSLQQEREKAEALTKEVSDTRSRISAEAQARKSGEQKVADIKQAAEGAAELKKSLSQEHERAGRLEQDLAAARRDVEKAETMQTAKGERGGGSAEAGRGARNGGAAKILACKSARSAESLTKEVSAARSKISSKRRRVRPASSKLQTSRKAG